MLYSLILILHRFYYYELTIIFIYVYYIEYGYSKHVVMFININPPQFLLLRTHNNLYLCILHRICIYKTCYVMLYSLIFILHRFYYYELTIIFIYVYYIEYGYTKHVMLYSLIFILHRFYYYELTIIFLYVYYINMDIRNMCYIH